MSKASASALVLTARGPDCNAIGPRPEGQRRPAPRQARRRAWLRRRRRRTIARRTPKSASFASPANATHRSRSRGISPRPPRPPRSSSSPVSGELLAVSDSGNGGAAMLWRIPSGPVRPLRLPLDPAASDDLEGAAWEGGHLYTLTSSGAVRRFSRDGKGALVRDQDAYPLGPPPGVCAKLTDGNCGRNYEGLCLRAASATAVCAGYAMSKAEGSSSSVSVWKGDRLALDDVRQAARARTTQARSLRLRVRSGRRAR